MTRRRVPPLEGEAAREERDKEGLGFLFSISIRDTDSLHSLLVQRLLEAFIQKAAAPKGLQISPKLPV